MEAEDPLANLADIHLPGPVSFWPPAPGWWVLACVLLALLVYGAYRYARHWQRLQRMRHALDTLQHSYDTYNNAPSDKDHNAAGLQFLQGCNEVLKRVALLHYPQADVASLNGRQWLKFLESTGAQLTFVDGVGAVLADGPYRASFKGDPEALLALCRQWIEAQYRTAPEAADRPAGGQTA